MRTNEPDVDAGLLTGCAGLAPRAAAKPGSSSITWLLCASLCSTLLAACGETGECGPGTVLVDGLCAPICAPGTEIDGLTGECISVCIEGTRRDEESGSCLPESAACTSGRIWDIENEECIDVDGICARGTTWVAGEARCVDDAELRTPDYVEGSDENDPMWGGPSAFEYFELPAQGEPVTLHGTVGYPRDRNGDGVMNADFDFWIFEVEEPTLLRIAADGIGGASSGFHLIPIEGPEFHRLAIGTTSNDVVRDVFLPRAGAYALIASDALNFVARGVGPFHGGGDFGYFIALTPLPIPEPQELNLVDDTARGSGHFPIEPPEEGSMLGFYSIDVTGGSAYLLQIESLTSGPVWEDLVVVPEREPSVWSRKIMKGFAEDDRLLLVADYSYYFGVAAAEHSVTVSKVETLWMDEELPSTSIEQQGWGYGQLLPATWLGFEAAAQEVVTVEIESSTGRTCAQAWDGLYRWILGEANCVMAEEDPARPTDALRFFAFEDGFHGLTVVDWAGAVFSGGLFDHVPDHDFEVGLRVLRQRPFDIGTFSGFWSGSVALEAGMPERYGTVVFPAHQAVKGLLGGEHAPWIRFYENGYGELRQIGSKSSGDFVWRPIEREWLLFGVGHEDEGGAEIELDITPVDFPTVGAVPASGSLAESVVLPEGQSRWIMHLEHRAPGMVLLDLVHEGAADLLARPLDGNLTPRLLEPLALQAPSGASLRLPISDDGIFFEIMTADGSPLAADAEVSIHATLTPAKTEGAGNYHYVWSQRLESPSAVSASITSGDDIDWYRLDVEEPTVLTIQTLPRTVAPANATVVYLATRSGTAITWDTASGVGRHGLVSHQIDTPGTYTFAVAGVGGETGGYLLSVITTNP